jgi:hydroxymethylpyrimidine/phosphomethylpyrimidine kinase
LRDAIATDLLFADGEVFEYHAPFVQGVATHGMGCTYSAAIAAGMARGLPLRAAVREAKHYITEAVTHFLRWEKNGRTTDALHHFAKANR